MKKINLVFIGALLGVFLVLSSCSKDNEDPSSGGYESLSISKKELSFYAKDSRKGFTIESNTSWEIDPGNSTWFTITPMAGEDALEVFVEPEENTGTSQRSALVTVATKGKTQEITIVQQAATNYEDKFFKRAETTMDNIFKNMWNDTENVMYDKYPNEMKGKSSISKLSYDRGFTFLWGFSSVFSSYNVMTHHTEDAGGYGLYFDKYGGNLMQGLDVYDNSDKTPRGYAAFGNAHDDRYYDDNVWIGIDLLELDEHTRENKLQTAKIVWNFIMSGRDEVLGDGVYWKEGDKSSKNTCSNAPVVVMGVKMYQATQAPEYLTAAKELYAWTKEKLQDPSDYLYWDNIRTIDGSIDEPKYHYNSGQMMQAAVLLYNETGEEAYLTDAQNIAEACYTHFFEDYTSPDGLNFRIVKDRDIWFSAIMLRGFVELYHVDNNSKYLDAYEKSLDNAWKYSRDPKSGLFIGSFKGASEAVVSDTSTPKNLLVQGGFTEMFAKMFNVQNGIK